MHFFEDDLRSALRRKDPGTAFTRHVMARVNHEPRQTPAQQTEKRHGEELLHGLRWPPLRRALAGVFLAVLFAAGWAGLAKYREVEERRAGELAGQQAIAALRITTEKLNHVIERVQTASVQVKGGSYEEN